MRMMRALGLNTLTTYVFWNLHEPEPGKFVFDGDLDLGLYLRTAQEEGFHVILRPGPYICSEWDLGGLPAWLLKDPTLKLREDDPRFMEAARRYLERLAVEMAGFGIDEGGPIIMTQIENEYGVFGKNRPYMNGMRQLFEEAGLPGLPFTSDSYWGQDSVIDELAYGSFPDLVAALNFGQGESAARAFQTLERFRPNAVRFNSEFWYGWFDNVGGQHASATPAAGIANLRWMLENRVSFNIYMVHGGTNFGFMNGANLDRGTYKPITTSYDYDAAIDEAGRPTAKFHALRELMQQHLAAGEVLPEIPPIPQVARLPRVELTESAPLEQLLVDPVRRTSVVRMEELDQAYGFVLYRHHVRDAYRGRLRLEDLKDYAWLRQGERRLGALDRRLSQSELTVSLEPGKPLDLLVENMGRIHFSPAMTTERKGVGKVSTSAGELTDWEIYTLPLTDLSALRFSRRPAGAPAAVGPEFLRGRFELEEARDTFLDMRAFRKGVVFVNGRNLGRYWSVGPQQALYCPGAWLRRGSNEIVVLELEQVPERAAVQGLDDALFH
jgi:beta-galactosidase